MEEGTIRDSHIEVTSYIPRIYITKAVAAGLMKLIGLYRMYVRSYQVRGYR